MATDTRKTLVLPFFEKQLNDGPQLDQNPVYQGLRSLREQMAQLGADNGDISSEHRVGAINLQRHLLLRRYLHTDKELPDALRRFGLSLPKRGETNILAVLDVILGSLEQLLGLPQSITVTKESRSTPEVMDSDNALLHNLLGSRDARLSCYLMTTLPSLSEPIAINKTESGSLVRAKLTAGTLEASLTNLNEWLDNPANAALRPRTCLDLDVDPLCTGEINRSALVVKIKPRRDMYGYVQVPAKVMLSAGDVRARVHSSQRERVSLQVSHSWFEQLQVGDSLLFRDCRAANRRFDIVEKSEQGCLLESYKTSYISEDTLFRVVRGETQMGEFVLEGIPARPGNIPLHAGDSLLLAANRQLVVTPEEQPDGLAMIGCNQPELLAQIGVGDEVWFDEIHVVGKVESCNNGNLQIRIQQTPRDGAKLRGGQRISFPTRRLKRPAIDARLIPVLDALMERIELLAVNCPIDRDGMQDMVDQLLSLKGRTPGVLLKIDPQVDVRKIDEVLLVAMQLPAVGIMLVRESITRDMFSDHLFEVQRELISLSRTAHLPVVWGMPLLKRMTITGEEFHAELAEISVALQADCVLVDCGPFTAQALDVLRQRLSVQ